MAPTRFLRKLLMRDEPEQHDPHVLRFFLSSFSRLIYLVVLIFNSAIVMQRRDTLTIDGVQTLTLGVFFYQVTKHSAALLFYYYRCRDSA